MDVASVILGCSCDGDDGHARRSWRRIDDPGSDDDTWIHGRCGQPSPATIKEHNMLNIMRAGPYHNVLVETVDLMSKPEFSWIQEYRWSPEIIVGSATGRKARVWVHKDSSPSTASSTPATTASTT